MRLSKYSIYQIRKEFGSWNNYVIAAGDLPYHNTSEDKLLENYYNVKRKLGRVPYSIEMERLPYSIYSRHFYNSRYGTWSSFLNKVGDTPLKNRGIRTKDDLISYYWKIKRERFGELNGRPLLQTEFPCNYRRIKKYFDSYRKLLLELEGTPKKVIASCEMCEQAFEYDMFLSTRQRHICVLCLTIR
jgi:hypothetical protein